MAPKGAVARAKPKTHKALKLQKKQKRGEFETGGNHSPDPMDHNRSPTGPPSTSEEEPPGSRIMSDDQVPQVSPADRRRPKRRLRLDFSSAISKMRKTLNDTKHLRIKKASIRILSSIANDLIERFTDDANKLTRDKQGEVVLVRSAEAAVKLNIPKTVETMVIALARKAVLKYNSHHATTMEKKAALPLDDFGDKILDKKDPKNEAKKDNKPSKKETEVANMSIDEFCSEIRSVAKKSREALSKENKYEKSKPGGAASGPVSAMI